MAYTNWAFNQLSDDKLPESYNECVSREAPLVGYTAAAAKCEDDEHTGS